MRGGNPNSYFGMAPPHYAPEPKIAGHLNQEDVQKMLVQLSRGVDAILNDHERRYVRSLIDPFSPDAVGVRVPSLNPVATYTNCQFESFSLNSGPGVPNGKIMVIINLTAIRPRPVLVIQDSQGTF